MRPQHARPFQSQNRVLAGLPPSDCALLAPFLRAVALPSGAHPQQHALPLDDVYFPHDGVMSLLRSRRRGRRSRWRSAAHSNAIDERNAECGVRYLGVM